MLGWTFPARALLVDLDAYVDLPILSTNGTPIQDGSWVFIIGSTDTNQDPMATYGGTNLIANSVTGDDVILLAIQIPYNVGTNSGTFFATTQYESDDINYVYIRFFDTVGPLTGMLWWGTSSMFQLGITLGVSTVQFDQLEQLSVTNYNNFVVIPEPSTLQLFVLVGGVICAVRFRPKEPLPEGDAPPEPPEAA